MHDIIPILQSLDPLAVLAGVFLIAFAENLFPPLPSDVAVVFAGSLVGLGQVGFLETVLAGTAGSTLGFMAMYKIGDWFGDRILEQGRLPFIPVSAVMRVEAWFGRYGYWVVAANRFLAGTRAVVSFFAGMSELDLKRSAALSFLSALLWNGVLVSAGYALGRNWTDIGSYLSTYSRVVTGALVLALLVWLVLYVARRRSRRRKT